jgi:drug/metabolite transporter (DMT)-like permease
VSSAAETPRQQALLAAMPWVFVGVWSTGFVVARLAMPHAPPLTFLAWRYALSLLAFGLWIRWAGVAWPQGRAQWGHLAVTGVLMHAGYLGGVWAAVKAGIPAGVVALIVGLQPVLTALWVSRRGHQAVAAAQWWGLALGLAGVGLVVWPRLSTGEVTPVNLALSLGALAAITAGTLYQKAKVAPVDVRSGNFVQLLAAGLVTAPLAWLEPGQMQWHPDLLLALAWSVLGLSLGASSLLMILIQRGAATRVTSLFYLVPPCTAVMAWLMFSEPLGWAGVLGMALCAAGVGLVLRAPPGQ